MQQLLERSTEVLEPTEHSNSSSTLLSSALSYHKWLTSTSLPHSCQEKPNDQERLLKSLDANLLFVSSAARLFGGFREQTLCRLPKLRCRLNALPAVDYKNTSRSAYLQGHSGLSCKILNALGKKKGDVVEGTAGGNAVAWVACCLYSAWMYGQHDGLALVE
eukprot:5983585-Amphidinium_carterae.1